MNICIRCATIISNPRFPKTKICKSCSKQGMKRGEEHWNYKDGAYTYETFRKELRNDRQYCESCNKDLKSATHYKWVIHHKDHNHYNNDIENLQLLCKACHATTHKIESNFGSATTISKESTPK